MTTIEHINSSLTHFHVPLEVDTSVDVHLHYLAAHDEVQEADSLQRLSHYLGLFLELSDGSLFNRFSWLEFATKTCAMMRADGISIKYHKRNLIYHSNTNVTIAVDF